MLTVNPTRTAVLVMDYQQDVVTHFVPVEDEMLQRAARVLERTRAAGIPVVYVVTHFRPAHPEIVPDRGLFRSLRAANQLVEGTPGAAVHSAVAPVPGDVIVTKKRVGAFSGSDLEYILRAFGRTHLVLFGVATSGVVLSTVRAAADLDYDMQIIADCCADRDEEVHRVLVGKIFQSMAPAVSADEFVAALDRLGTASAGG